MTLRTVDVEQSPLQRDAFGDGDIASLDGFGAGQGDWIAGGPGVFVMDNDDIRAIER